jgi:hypothetical protein
VVRNGRFLWGKFEVGAFAGPDISESGLVLALDAGNTNGYDNDENLLTYSEQFNNAAWSKNNYNVTANATTAPDGTLTADKLIAINASTFHDLYKSPGLGSNTYTLSIFAKVAEQSFIQLRIDDGAISRLAMFNLSTGSVSSSSNVTSPTITSYPNGWYRCSITVTSAIVNVVFNGYPTSSNATYSGDGVSGVFIWGAQFEYGSVATGYTPTTTTAKTRGTTWTDLSGNGNNGTLVNGVGYVGTNGGSLSFDGSDDYVDCGNNSILDVGNNITANAWFYVNSNSSYQPIVSKVLSDFSLGWEVANSSGAFRTTFRPSATQINLSVGGVLVIGNWYMGTMTFDGTTARLYLNGVQVGSTTSGGPVTLNSTQSLTIGRRVQGNFYDGNIAQVSIYNRALTPQEIQQNFNALRSRFQ